MIHWPARVLEKSLILKLRLRLWKHPTEHQTQDRIGTGNRGASQSDLAWIGRLGLRKSQSQEGRQSTQDPAANICGKALASSAQV
jgi:hypothetical protein